VAFFSGEKKQNPLAVSPADHASAPCQPKMQKLALQPEFRHKTFRLHQLAGNAET
jgi:hypothetical protein